MTEKISKISFKNYKGFADASIEFSPLSVIVGANSTGKSALLKLVLLISQSLSAESVSLFTCNGPLVEMGEAANIFPGYNKDLEMEFRFHYEHPIPLSHSLESFYSTVRFPIRRDLMMITGADEIVRRARELRAQLGESTDWDALRNAANFLHKNAERADENEGIDGEVILSKNYKALTFVAEIALTLAQRDVRSILYKVRYKKDSPVIAKVVLESVDGEILHYRPIDARNEGPIVKIDGIDSKKLSVYFKAVREIIRPVSFRFVRRPAAKGLVSSQTALVNPVGFFIGTILQMLARPVLQNFANERVRHISPLRAYPRRYYLLDGRDYEKSETERVIGLLRARPALTTEINKWLGLLGHRVDLAQIHESIFKILVNDGKLSSDLTDVGFGLSQVLPVILEPIIADEGDLVVIQQPEIHLHPKAQSILADFFIWAVKTKGCTLVVETHSEYLLRRLRRRIGEGVFSPDSPTGISKSAVALMSIEKSDGISFVNKLDLDEKGDFKWPKEFLDDEVEDLLAFMQMTAEPGTEYPKRESL